MACRSPTPFRMHKSYFFLFALHLASAAVHAESSSVEARWDQLVPAASRAAQSRTCRPPPPGVLRQADLAHQDTELLPLICWDGSDEAAAGVLSALRQTRRGIPSDVQCTPTQWWAITLMLQGFLAAGQAGEHTDC